MDLFSYGKIKKNNKKCVAKKKVIKKLTKANEIKNIRLRSYAVSSVIFGVFVWLCINLVLIGIVPVSEPVSAPTSITYKAPLRGNIYDVNGQLVATTIEVRSLYADPKSVMDINEVVTKLSKVMPSISKKSLRKKLNRKARFVWLARKLTPTQVKNINDLGLPGIDFRKENVRIYPQKNIMAHVLGGVNGEGNGISGIEKSYNEQLQNGENITLTIDLRLQSILRNKLQNKMVESGSKGASAVALNPQDGSVIAMVSLPDYDLNNYGNSAPETWQNRATYSLYEMGSTFKIFTLAEGLEEEKITPLSKLDCRKPIKIGKFKIRDFHAKKRVLTATEVFRYSSNVGAAKIADMFKSEEQREFYRKLNLLDPVNINIAEKGRSIYPRSHGRVYTLTMAFGHGIAVTNLHVAAAAGALVGDGYYKTPYLVAGKKPEIGEKVVSMNTVKMMRNLMRDVAQNGTAHKARVAGYDIGGKTGTAEKNIHGKYIRNKSISSFVGALPLNNPKMVVNIVMDEGKIDGKSGGGRIAAPVFADFIRSAAPLIGLLPEKVTQIAEKSISNKNKKEVKKTSKPVYNKPVMQSPNGAELDEIFRLVASAN